MATYKVIQDVEAEDKLLGPLTLRQFIYAAVAVLCFYLTFLVVSKGAGFMAVVFMPIGGISGFFAWPWSRDQPTEVWALAKIRFMLKPRKRIWDQSGVKELVSVTVPKKLDISYTNNLSQGEVESRLKALADMIDSRGWATKNVNINLYSGQQAFSGASSDRLVEASTLPAVVEANVDINESDDVLEDSSPVAQQFDTMIAASTRAHHEEIMEHMREPAPTTQVPPLATRPGQIQAPGQPANNYWFLNQPAVPPQVPDGVVTFSTPQVIAPVAPVQAQTIQSSQMPQPAPEVITPEDEQALIARLRDQEAKENSVNPYGHYHIVQPLSGGSAPAQNQTGMPVQGQSNPVAQQNPGTPPAQGQSFGPPQQPMYAAPGTASPAVAVQPYPYSQPSPQTVAQQVTPPPNPAILQLARNDDLDVATIAREANKQQELQDEVVISLH